MNYIVITTTCSTESLLKIVSSLEEQSVKPLAWFIFNDTNKDLKLSVKGINVFVPNLEKNNYWYYKRLAGNLNKLVNFIPKDIWVKTDYVLKLDDDTILPKNYVKTLVPFLEYSNFGCVSGKILSSFKGKFVSEKRINNYALGTGMLFRKEILDYLGGYPVIAGSDTLINLVSRKMGFQNQQINFLEFKQIRLTCENSKMSRALCIAIKQYYLRYPLILIILNLRRCCKKDFFVNWYYFSNFVKLNVKEDERLNDKSLVWFNKKRLFLMCIRFYKKRFVEKLKKFV